MTDPVGVPGASTTTLAPYCDESDIPRDRLKDSNGQPLGDVDIAFAIGASTELLYHLSGRKYRTGRSIVRPVLLGAVAAIPRISPGGWLPLGTGGGGGWTPGWAWAQIGPGFWTGNDQTEVVLQGPVTKINSVIVDGATLAPDRYAVYERRRLVRAVGASWPWNQNLQAPITDVGTFQIDYEWGLAPGAGGRLACAALALDLALAFSGQDTHRLPARVISIATQGVNVAVGDALDFIREDLTGIPAVDLWLRAVNPTKRRRRSVIMSPGSTTGRSS